KLHVALPAVAAPAAEARGLPTGDAAAMLELEPSVSDARGRFRPVCPRAVSAVRSRGARAPRDAVAASLPRRPFPLAAAAGLASPSRRLPPLRESESTARCRRRAVRSR